MKSRLIIVCLLFFSFAFAFGQGKVGINTSSPLAMLHVKDSSVVFTGINPLPAIPGNPPVSGAGTRMMWYPDKAAFRVGNVTAAQWNKDSIGLNSFAIGINTKAIAYASTAIGVSTTASGSGSTATGYGTTASGIFSTALGYETVANAFHSTAMGDGSTASGNYGATAMGYRTIASGENSTAMGGLTTAGGVASMAMGFSTIATNYYSTAMGSFTKASGYAATGIGDHTMAIGKASLAMGYQTLAKPYAAVVLGQFNDTSSVSPLSWNLLDPVFIIGNGNANDARHNALTVLKNGKTGINTSTPDAMLHIVRNGSSGGTYYSNSSLIIESDQPSYLQFSNNNYDESGLLSGNVATSIRSGLIFRADSSIHIRTGGNTFRFTIDKNGKTGINTSSPQAMVHIVKTSPSGGPFNPNLFAIYESNQSAFIQFSNPTTNETGLLSGNGLTAIRSALIFAADSSVQVRAGGNTNRMYIKNNGNIGINTVTPAARLDVNGTAIIGVNGTSLTEIIKLTVSKDVAFVAANSTIAETFAVANSATTSTVYISPASALTDGLILAYARVSVAGIVEVKFTNTTASTIDPPNMNYYITVIR